MLQRPYPHLLVGFFISCMLVHMSGGVHAAPLPESLRQGRVQMMFPATSLGTGMVLSSGAASLDGSLFGTMHQPFGQGSADAIVGTFWALGLAAALPGLIGGLTALGRKKGQLGWGIAGVLNGLLVGVVGGIFLPNYIAAAVSLIAVGFGVLMIGINNLAQRAQHKGTKLQDRPRASTQLPSRYAHTRMELLRVSL